MKQAKRKKVQDLLSLEIRKLETEWIKLKETENTSAAPMDVAPTTSTNVPVQNKRYQIKLNGYGKLSFPDNLHLNPTLLVGDI